MDNQTSLNCFSEFDQAMMHRALDLAKQGEKRGEVPVGAVLTLNQEIIAEAYNQSITLNDPTAHAEILVLRDAGQELKNYRLVDTTLYVSLEPCAMCAGALVHARIKRLVYAANDPKTGAIQSVMNLANHPCLNHHIEVDSGLLQDQSRDLLQQFFKARR